MSDLTNIEKRYIEKFFEIAGGGGGYVLNFSNRTLQELVMDSLGIDIYSDKYDYNSGSKANRLRRFFEIEDNEKSGKLIADMIQYLEVESDLNDNVIISEKDQGIINKCREISERLLNSSIKTATENSESEKDIFKMIRKNEIAIKENLLSRQELESIKDQVEKFLDKNLQEGSLDFLRYRKMKTTRVKQRDGTLWVGSDGYPANGYSWIRPYFEAFENYLGSKKLKNKLENEKLWVQSNSKDDEEHIFVGEKNNVSGEKVHLILGKTGEIRIDAQDKAPHDLLRKVETVLTLKSGEKIRSTRAVLEFDNK